MSLIKKMQDRLGIAGELLAFLWANKLWWMIPMIIILAGLGLFIFMATQTGAAPLVYSLF